MSKECVPYRAGTADVDSSGVKVELSGTIRQILVYPTVDAQISLNDSSTDSVFLPSGMWTPVSVSIDYNVRNFTVTSNESGKVHWQGWVI